MMVFSDKDSGFGVKGNIVVHIKFIVLTIYDKYNTLQEHRNYVYMYMKLEYYRFIYVIC